jgi:hypothetical protein
MRLKLLKKYNGIPAGAVAEFNNAQQLLDAGIAVWVPQDTACKLKDAELYGECTHPIKQDTTGVKKQTAGNGQL